MVVLDTDVLINISKNHEQTVRKVNELEKQNEITTTVINAEEFLFGLLLKGSPEEIFLGKEFLKKIIVYDYTSVEAEKVAEIRVQLEKQKASIGKYDQIIAGICIAKNEPLFTLNLKHFRQIKWLKLIH